MLGEGASKQPRGTKPHRFAGLAAVPQPEVGGDEAAAGGGFQVVQVRVHLQVSLGLAAKDLHLVLVEALVAAGRSRG